jgi:hypothetical protein
MPSLTYEQRNNLLTILQKASQVINKIASLLLEDEEVTDSDLMKIHRKLTVMANLLDTTFADEDES